jgi:hypothetical protein
MLWVLLLVKDNYLEATTTLLAVEVDTAILLEVLAVEARVTITMESHSLEQPTQVVAVVEVTKAVALEVQV